MRSNSRPFATPRSSLPSSFAEPAAVFRSARRGACDERALVLVAVGIACEIQFDEHGYALLVEGTEREAALQQLWLYEQDRSRRAASRSVPSTSSA